MDSEGLQSTERHEDTVIIPQRFRFLDLPPELRNCVYFWMEPLNASLVRQHKAIWQVDGGNWVFMGKWYCNYDPAEVAAPTISPSQPSITRVCRQIRQETLPIFYGGNSFVLDDMYYKSQGIHTPFPVLVIRWLDRIAGQLHLIKDLEVWCDEDNAQRAHELVAVLTDRYHGLNQDVLKAKDYY